MQTDTHLSASSRPHFNDRHKSMLPSLHDNYLVSYEVNCEARQIKIFTRRQEWAEERESRIVVFSGVEGYHFENDAFGNIVLALEVVPVERLLSDHGARIAESYRVSGAPGPWAADLASARRVLIAEGVKGFVLSSSYGLSGWVLAKDASVSLSQV